MLETTAVKIPSYEDYVASDAEARRIASQLIQKK